MRDFSQFKRWHGPSGPVVNTPLLVKDRPTPTRF